MHRPDGQSIFLGTVIFASLAWLGYLFLFNEGGLAVGRGGGRGPNLKDIPVNGERAYQFLNRICSLGPRPSGSVGMVKQRRMLVEHFQSLGSDVKLQQFHVRHPVNDSPVAMVNIVVHWHPGRLQRILLCAHYDTRPYPDRDPDRQRRKGTFIGANDGASGTALLAELAYHLPELAGPLGVDFVLFDGEEFVFTDRTDKYFLGSEYFARDYVRNAPPYRYQSAVLLDMVGDADLQIYQEGHSARWPESRPLVSAIWTTAQQLGVHEFVPVVRHQIRDDHLALRNIAGIPACDLIDFDYPRPGRPSYWHTEADTSDKCSALSLAKVGWVVLEWLKSLQQKSADASTG